MDLSCFSLESNKVFFYHLSYCKFHHHDLYHQRKEMKADRVVFLMET